MEFPCAPFTGRHDTIACRHQSHLSSFEQLIDQISLDNKSQHGQPHQQEKKLLACSLPSRFFLAWHGHVGGLAVNYKHLGAGTHTAFCHASRLHSSGDVSTKGHTSQCGE